jgi:hypothetical protein
MNSGTLTAQILLNDKQVNFDLNQINETKYEIKMLPNKTGNYKVRIFLNGVKVKGSPFTIKIGTSLDDSFKNQPNKGSSNSPTKSNSLIRTEIIKNYDKKDLVVDKELKLKVILVERNSNEKFKNLLLNMNIESKMKYNNCEPVDHKFEVNADGSYQVSCVPKKAGNYFVSFYRDGRRIEGSPYKLVVQGKAVKKLIKPNYAQVGIPYILIRKFWLFYFHFTDFLKINSKNMMSLIF